jgi:transcriptional regulator with XRE-family HTH domain
MEDKEYGSTHTLKSVRRKTGLKQTFFGMILGMSKDAVSRIENGHRRETAIHTELISLVAFLFEMGLLEKYVQWRFRLNTPTLKAFK